MKLSFLASLTLMLAHIACAGGLPSDMTGPVCGFLSSQKNGTYNYTSHPRIDEIGSILDGALTLNSKNFSDFSIKEKPGYTLYRSRKDDCLVDILIPKPFRSFYMITIKHDDGTFEGYTIKKEKTEPNQSPEPMPMAVTPPAAQASRQP